MAYEASTTEDDFGRMLADLFERLGFEVEFVPAPDGLDRGLIVRYPSRIRHAITVQAVHGAYPAATVPVQRALALMQYYGAGEGWAVTDASFAPEVREFAMANGVRLIEGPGLSGLLTQATTEKGREAAVDALLAHSGFYDKEPDVTTVQRPPVQQLTPQEPQIQPTMRMPRQQVDYDYAPADYTPPVQIQDEPGAPVQREAAPRRRPSGCRAGCVTVLVILLVLTLFLMGMLLALPTVLDQLPLGEALSAIKAHALTFFEQLKDAVANKLASMAG